MSDTDWDALQAAVRERLATDEALIRRLVADPPKLSNTEDGRLALIQRVAESGFQGLRLRSEARLAKAEDLVRAFLEYGVFAVFGAGAVRGGDFLLNQLRGRWAEQVVLSMTVSDMVLYPFGPTGAAMPGEEDYRRIRMTFDAISRLEGKRPDVIGFSTANVETFGDADLKRISEWPDRPLEGADLPILRKACVGIEVKNSAWCYGPRRANNAGALSITVKQEEIILLESWSNAYEVPVVFVQVLFDEAYVMSFRRMCQVIANTPSTKGPYKDGDYFRDTQTGEKDYHHIYTGLYDQTYRCADVEFPDKSQGVVARLPDGSVVPYIKFAPSQATNVRSDTIWREVRL